MMARRDTFECDSKLFRKVRIEDAVGLPLAHDITEIRPGEFKGPAFRRGQRIAREDLCHLMRLGKRHLYVLKLDEHHIHEDDGVLMLAEALAGPGVTFNGLPREGKIQLVAAHDGLFKVKVEPLIQFNLIPEVMCASIHTDTPVRKGQPLAGTRVIPLVVNRDIADAAVAIARSHHPIFSVKEFQQLNARLIITGNEVYEGLIEDRFEQLVNSKLEAYGSSLVEARTLPDDEAQIAQTIQSYLNKDTDLIITTGGMSVDPDDVTRLAIARAGVDHFHYGAAVLPGAMFLIAYRGALPIVGIPACALYHQATIFDLILPRLLAGERPDHTDLARFAHGGFCLDCPTCRFPACPFGKTTVPQC